MSLPGKGQPVLGDGLNCYESTGLGVARTRGAPPSRPTSCRLSMRQMPTDRRGGISQAAQHLCRPSFGSAGYARCQLGRAQNRWRVIRTSNAYTFVDPQARTRSPDSSNSEFATVPHSRYLVTGRTPSTSWSLGAGIYSLTRRGSRLYGQFAWTKRSKLSCSDFASASRPSWKESQHTRVRYALISEATLLNRAVPSP